MEPIEFLKPKEGPILFYRDPSDNKAIVDSAYLSDLKVFSIPTYYQKDEHVLGIIKQPKAINPLHLLKQLIEADVLLTYMHIESNMTVEVIAEKPIFKADVKGTHIYFTNQENEDEFAFRVQINESGEIKVLKK